ncbi:MAG: hypothetical protein A2W91_02565 [Bacteroidetes bacterium GWF2_38_335]|nr:MAG: hypothetical protein A2W91_02560 [Bacteroidetes bacterium GWF2_38_335]OFY36444.1 MAG: hypothetical protein A2W91_02565 [Bacteroidetes bacterium GWF2_38_335]
MNDEINQKVRLLKSIKSKVYKVVKAYSSAIQACKAGSIQPRLSSRGLKVRIDKPPAKML